MAAENQSTPPEPFPLDAEMVARLKALGEQTRRGGVGMLASANYFAQGHVQVPSAWLVELIERAEAANG